MTNLDGAANIIPQEGKNGGLEKPNLGEQSWRSQVDKCSEVMA